MAAFLGPLLVAVSSPPSDTWRSSSGALDGQPYDVRPQEEEAATADSSTAGHDDNDEEAVTKAFALSLASHPNARSGSAAAAANGAGTWQLQEREQMGQTATTPSKASTGDASIERDAERLKVSRERYGRPITVVYVMGKIDHFNFWYQVAKEKDYAVLTQRYLCKQSATSKRHKEQHLTTKAVDAAIMKMVKLGYSRILFVGYPCDEASSRAALEANASFAYSAAIYYTVHNDQKRPRLLKHLLCNHKKTLVHYDFIKRGDWDGETLHMLKANPLNDHFEEAGRVRHYLLALFEELIEKANLDAEPEGPASTGTYIYCDLDQDNDEEYAGSRFEGTQRDEVAVEKDVLPKTTETVDSDRTKNTANSLKTQRTQLSAIQPSLQVDSVREPATVPETPVRDSKRSQKKTEKTGRQRKQLKSETSKEDSNSSDEAQDDRSKPTTTEATTEGATTEGTTTIGDSQRALK